MASCVHCGRWAGRDGEPCPHCGSSPHRKGAPGNASARSISFVDDFASDPAPAEGAAETQRTPTAAEIERWYPALDESPVFAGMDGSARGPGRAAADLIGGPAAPPVAPPVPPTVQPLPTVVPVVTPIGAASADGRTVAIDVRTEFVSYAAADEPLVNVLVTLTPDGPPLLDPATEPVAHVILALDVSASMNRTDKYPLLTEAIEGMLHDLRRPGGPDVLLSVVLYAYGAEVVFRDRPASSLDPREVLRAIDRSALRFGRYTDMVGALRHAGRIAREQVLAHRAMPVRICVLTDGRPQDVEGTRRVVAQIRKMPVDVDALAFGRDADVAVLQDLVSGGRGGTVKQVRADSIGEAFGRIAETAARVVSNRAILDFGLAAGVAGGEAFRYRPARHRFGDGAFEGGRVFRTDLGTLEAGRPYSLLFRVRLPAVAGWESELGTITLRLPAHGGARTFEAQVAVARHAGDETLAPDREVEEATDVLAALGAADPKEQLRALRVRRRIYESERRDPRLVEAIDRAIRELEQGGTLDRLSAEEQAAILSHTRSVVGAR